MIVRNADPFNAEPELGALISKYLTPQALFYVRSHGDVPHLPVDYRIEISGLRVVPRSFNVEELKSAFPVRKVTAVLQCAGNRRADFQQVAETSGLGRAARYDSGSAHSRHEKAALRELQRSCGTFQEAHTEKREATGAPAREDALDFADWARVAAMNSLINQPPATPAGRNALAAYLSEQSPADARGE